MGSVQAKNHLAGVGLVEILIAIAILALVSLAAAPQLIDYIQNRRLYNSLNEFQSAVTLARSEAIRRNTSVRLSSINSNPNNLWGDGWRVWIDENANNQFEANVDLVLLSRGILPPGVTVNNAAGVATIEFSGSGFIRNFTPNNVTTQAIDIQLCTSNSGEVISISINGLTSNMRGNCA